jgi:hypothetical protein
MALSPDELTRRSPRRRAAERRRIMDGIIRGAARSSTRKPWEELFFNGDFSAPLARDEGRGPRSWNAYAEVPSASNKQPWRIVRDGSNRGSSIFI